MYMDENFNVEGTCVYINFVHASRGVIILFSTYYISYYYFYTYLLVNSNVMLISLDLSDMVSTLTEYGAHSPVITAYVK